MFKDAFKYACAGSVERANVWAPILGAAVIGVAALALPIPWAHPSDAPQTIEFLAACLGVSWLVIVTGRFLYWPWKTIAGHQKSSKKSPLEIFFDPENAEFWETAENPHEYAPEEEKYGEFYSIEVVNHGHQSVDGITVVYWYDGQTNHHKAYGTAKTQISLDPGGRKLVKLFFQSAEDYRGHDETADPAPRQISVRATAKDTISSPVLRLDFQPTGGGGLYDNRPIYAVSIRE